MSILIFFLLDNNDRQGHTYENAQSLKQPENTYANANNNTPPPKPVSLIIYFFPPITFISH